MFKTKVTVEPFGFPMEVVAWIDKGEPPILFPTDRAHPGCAPYADIDSVWVREVNIYDILSQRQLDTVGEAVLRARDLL